MFYGRSLVQLQRAPACRTSAFTRKRCHYLPRHATETVQSNYVKVVPVQKTGPPVLRNEKTRKSTASGKKKPLRHHRAAQRACINSSGARPEIFLILSFHAVNVTHTILTHYIRHDDESGIFDFNRSYLLTRRGSNSRILAIRDPTNSSN